MSYGLKVTTDDDYIALHSDYSGMVYVGEMTQVTTTPSIVVYDGADAVEITESNNNYFLGKHVQYRYQSDVEYIVPFYMPVSAQWVTVMECIHSGGYWYVDILYKGGVPPRVFVFAQLSELNPTVKTGYGINVFNSSSKPVFTSNEKPLRITSIEEITYPSTYSDNTCPQGTALAADAHVDFSTPGINMKTLPGIANYSSDMMYSCIPSAYGGSHYTNTPPKTSENCDCTDRPLVGGRWCTSKKYTSKGYSSWVSYRGAITIGNTGIYTTYVHDSAGAIYKEKKGICGLPLLVEWLFNKYFVLLSFDPTNIFSGLGTAANYVYGALTRPDVQVYDKDKIYDQNKVDTMLVTKASYYGIT